MYCRVRLVHLYVLYYIDEEILPYYVFTCGGAQAYRCFRRGVFQVALALVLRWTQSWLKALMMIPIVQLRRQHPAASQKVAQPPSPLRSICGRDALFLTIPRPRLLSRAQTATSLGSVAEAPLRAVSGAAEMLPSKVRRCCERLGYKQSEIHTTCNRQHRT